VTAAVKGTRSGSQARALRVVLDTNVVVSALLFRRGLLGRVRASVFRSWTSTAVRSRSRPAMRELSGQAAFAIERPAEFLTRLPGGQPVHHARHRSDAGGRGGLYRRGAILRLARGAPAA
jgi:hypothetical protein